MAASDKTIAETLKVILKHLDFDIALELLSDLRQIKSNSSFMQTIDLLLTGLKEMQK